jgi:hypothetical protein
MAIPLELVAQNPSLVASCILGLLGSLCELIDSRHEIMAAMAKDTHNHEGSKFDPIGPLKAHPASHQARARSHAEQQNEFGAQRKHDSLVLDRGDDRCQTPLRLRSTLEVSGRCHSDCQVIAQDRSGPID